MTFAFGDLESERIEVEVRGYERAPTGEFGDDNWLTIGIRVWAGGFRGDTTASIQAGELTRFLRELRLLEQTLSGAAEFTTIEDQLRLRLTGDGRGHIELRGEVADRAGDGNRLDFTLQFDQSQLGKSIRELERVVLEFPVSGDQPSDSE